MEHMRDYKTNVAQEYRFTKPTDVLPLDLVKTRSREIRV